MPLSFYPGWLLVEGEAQVTPERVGTFNVLYGPGLMWAIDGSSEVIHDLNSGRIPVVESKTVAVAGTVVNRDGGGPSFLKSPMADLDLMVKGPDYLRFFCGSVWGDEGPFNLVESVDAPVLQGVKSPNDTWRDRIKPVIMHQAGESLIAEALVVYNAGLFGAKFIIFKDGVVSMADDDPIADVELPKQELLSPFRNLRPGAVRIMSSKDGR